MSEGSEVSLNLPLLEKDVKIKTETSQQQGLREELAINGGAKLTHVLEFTTCCDTSAVTIKWTGHLSIQ